MLNSKKNKFIVFEGIEGSGKTTQINLLSDYLAKNNLSFVQTREPGGTKAAEDIRNLLVKGGVEKWERTSEILLFYAARIENIEKIIKPALDEGNIVICDRFFASTIAYQGFGYGIDVEFIKNLHSLTTANLIPDLTILLDADPEKTIVRANKRMENLKEKEDRFEKMDLSFHKRVREGFLKIAEQNQDRYFILNALEKPDNIHKRILEKI